MVGGQVKHKDSSTCTVAFYMQSLVALAYNNGPAQLLQPPPQDENHCMVVPDPMETS